MTETAPWSVYGGYLFKDEEAVCQVFNEDEAAHIVQACNAFPELVEALEECSTRFRRCIITSGTDEEYADGAIEKYVHLIKKARSHE